MSQSLSPAVQHALAQARVAIANTEQSLQATQLLLERLKQEYRVLDAEAAHAEKALHQDVVQIVKQMDEDTLEFLNKSTEE